MTTIRESVNGAHDATSYTGLGTGLTGIPRAGIISGTANHIVINDGAGALSSTASLGAAQGGTGANSSASTGLARVSTGTWTFGQLQDADTSTNTITRTKLKTGTANYVVTNDGTGAITEQQYLSPALGGTGANLSTTGSYPSGPYAMVLNTGVVTPTILASTATNSSVMSRDSSGNTAVTGIVATNATITSGTVTTLTTTAVVMAPNGSSASREFTSVVSTADATLTTLYSLATSSAATNATTYGIRVTISFSSPASSGSTGFITYLVKAVNKVGTLTTSGKAGEQRIVDTALDAVTSTVTVSGINLLINVTGIVSTAINWVGRVELLSNTA